VKDNRNDELNFGVISITTKELMEMPQDSLDFLLAASFIMNDIRFYWSMMLRSPNDAEEPDVQSIQMIRLLWCTRKLASVIYEAVKTLDFFSGKIQTIKKLAREKGPPISSMNRKSKFNTVSRVFRDKSTYHYSKKDLTSELETFNADAVHRIFVHEQRGNSISEFAEQIFTLPTLNRISQKSDFSEFNTWCSQCSGSIMTFCEVATAQLLFEVYPNKIYPSKKLQTKYESETMDHRWPLFLIIPVPEKAE
jgi:hypothetical protein